MAYVEREMEKLGISAFECKNRQLAQRLFTGTALTEADVITLGFIMHSGAFGTVQHRVSNQATRQRGGKLRYILRRVSVPIRKSAPDYAAYANHYPFFYKHRPLLLLLPGYRIMRGLFSGRLFKELKAVKNADGR